MVYLLSSLTLVQSILMIEYKLWKNYGQIVYDYSGNSLHAVNGKASSSSNDNEGIFTDRGIYLSQTSLLKMPPNDITNSNFLLPIQYTLIFWTYSDDSNDSARLYCRFKSGLSTQLFRDKVNKRPYILFNFPPNYNWRKIQGITNTWFSSKVYLDVWILVSLEANINDIKVRLDNTEGLSTTLNQNYIESGDFPTTHLGTDTPSANGFGGFVAYFAISNTLSVYSNYLTLGSSNCLIGTCTSCVISYIIPGLGQGCGSSSNLLTKDASGNDCIDSYPCYGTLKIKCNCPSNSCLIESNSSCACMDYTTGVSYSTACACSSIGQGCCLEECESCENENECLMCKDENSYVGNTGRCECISGFYREGNIETNPCEKCLDECSECLNGNNCTKCNDLNTEIENGRCLCKIGYYNLTDLGNSSCLNCPSECESCSNNLTCLTCKVTNTQLLEGKCECFDGYWYNSSAPGNEVCSLCDSKCAKCKDLETCLQCKSENYLLIDGECICKKGFWYNENLPGHEACNLCDSWCAECENFLTCTQCISELYILVNGKCSCRDGYWYYENLNSNKFCSLCDQKCAKCEGLEICLQCKSNLYVLTNGLCNCKEGYWYNPNLTIGEFCILCDPGCAKCEDRQICTVCKSEHFLLENGQCTCKEGYWLNLIKNDCDQCNDECKTCRLKNFCTSCKNLNEIANNEGICECTEGYFRNESDMCELCGKNCKTCENSEICLTCLDPNYEVVNNKTCLLKCIGDMERFEFSCKCKFGYIESAGRCIQRKFTMDLRVSKLNKIKLKFSQNLFQSLEISEIDLKFSDSVKFEFKVEKISKKYYLIYFVFDEKLSNDINFKLKLKEPIFSYNGSELEKYEYKGNLFESYSINPKLNSLLEFTKALTKTIATYSILCSIISNPAASWALISSLQILPYIPIIKSEITPSIDEFCLAIGEFNILPNLMNYVFESSSANDPFEEAQKIGFTSSLFFVNFGKEIVILLVSVFIWPLLKILSSIESEISFSKLKSIIKNYTYSFFIRFYIQSSVDIGFYAIIQLKSKFNKSPGEFYFNQVWAIISIVAFLLSVPIIYFFLNIFYEKIKNPNELEFKEKYGSLFNEFKHNKGLISSIFYVFYLLRRLQFLITQVYFNSVPNFQVGSNVGASFIFFVYLMFYRPFKYTSIMISYICAEFCLLCNFCIVLVIVNDYSLINIEQLEYCFISSVYFSMFVQIAVVLYNNYISLRKFFRKTRKNVKSEI